MFEGFDIEKALNALIEIYADRGIKLTFRKRSDKEKEKEFETHETERTVGKTV